MSELQITNGKDLKVGVLALQGSVIEHRRMLERLGVEVTEVRLPDDLKGISGIIIPGGESTTQSKLLKGFELFRPLKEAIQNGMPVWGTCAGAILLAKKVVGKNSPDTLELMDITADRNWYGAQGESFIASIEINLSDVPEKNIEAVFIRAPKLKPNTSDVQVLATYENTPIFLQQNHMLVSAFHPELTNDTTVHKYFLKICQQYSRKRSI